jgi:hypothetical protein
MILSNTLSSSVVLNGATSTVSTPADTLAPLGFAVVSNGESWVGRPGPNSVINAVATPGSGGTSTFDWSQGSYFTWTPYGGACTLAFTNAQVGQEVILRITAASSANPTWPTTLTWYTGSSGTAPTITTKSCIVKFVCTGASTYDAWLVAQQS